MTEPLDIEAAWSQIGLAAKLVGDIATGTERWRMSIPAQPDRDSDLIFSTALKAGEDLVTEVRRLRTQLDKPCGSCHPCANWPAETWKQAGRYLPDVAKYGEMEDELRRLRAVVRAAQAVIAEFCDDPGCERLCSAGDIVHDIRDALAGEATTA